jgi:hypothetical protein
MKLLFRNPGRTKEVVANDVAVKTGDIVFQIRFVEWEIVWDLIREVVTDKIPHRYDSIIS